MDDEPVLQAMERACFIAYAFAHGDQVPYDPEEVREAGRELDALLSTTNAGERLALANPYPVEAAGYVGESYAACMALAARLVDPESVPKVNDVVYMQCVKEVQRATGKWIDCAPKKRKSPNDPRDKYIYDERSKTPPTPYAAIRRTIKATDGWSNLGDDQGARQAADRYAKRHGLAPVPKEGVPG